MYGMVTTYGNNGLKCSEKQTLPAVCHHYFCFSDCDDRVEPDR